MLPDLPKLRELARGEPTLRSVLQICDRQRLRNGTGTLKIILADRYPRIDSGAKWADLLRIFRLLQACGCGTLLQSSIRTRARFAWRVRPGAVLVGLDNQAPEVPLGEYYTPPTPAELAHAATHSTAAPPGWQRHAFPLRPDAPLALLLPADMTDAEAQRIGFFLRSIAQG